MNPTKFSDFILYSHQNYICSFDWKVAVTF